MSVINSITLILLLGSLVPAAQAENVLQQVTLKSCRPRACTQLETKEAFRSDLDSNLLVFAAAKMTIANLPAAKSRQTFEAGDGYLDFSEQVIVLRNLKNSVHHELIYNLGTGQFLFF